MADIDLIRNRVEDATWLLDAGVPPLEVAERLGTTFEALYILLRRHGYTSISLTNEMAYQRRKTT